MDCSRVLGSVQASLDEKKAELATKTAELQAAAVETARLMARLSALEAGSGPAASRAPSDPPRARHKAGYRSQ